MIAALMLVVGLVLGIGLGKHWFSCKHKSFFKGGNMLELTPENYGSLEDPHAALRE